MATTWPPPHQPRLPAFVRLDDGTKVVPFHAPNPQGPPIRAFYCLGPSSKRTHLRPGEELRVRHDGWVVGTSLDRGFFCCDAWPVVLYEVELAQRDLYPMGDLTLKTLAMRIVRQVPTDEMFGPRAAEIVAALETWAEAPWLAPKQAPDEARIEALVASYYAVLGRHALVKPCQVRIVRTWGDACAADRESVTPGLPAHIRSENTIRNYVDDEEYSFRTRALRRLLLRRIFGPLWDAAWQRASDLYLSSVVGPIPSGNGKAARRAWEKARTRLAEQREATCRRALQETLQQLGAALVPDDEDERTPEGIPASLNRMVDAAELLEITVNTWNFCISASRDITWSVALLLAAPEYETTMTPITALYAMGCWPIGETLGRFNVFVPPVPLI